MNSLMNRKILSLLCVVGLWTTFATLPAQADNSDDLLKSCQDMLHTKDFNLTTQICSSGISLYPNRTEFYLVRGFAYGNLNQNLAALEDFNKVLASYPQHLDTLFYRGNIYDALGEPEKALSDFSQIIKAEPKAALVLYRRATIYAGQGEFELAKKDIEAMLELQPFDPNGNKSLAQIEDLMEAYTYQGKSLKSPEMYMQEVHFLKQIQLSNNVLGNLSLMKGSPSSYELLSQCISRFPGNYACNKLILSDYENDKIMSKEFEKSQMAYWIEQNLMRIYSTVLKQEPQNSNIYFGRGLKYFYQYKNYPMAINDLSKAIQYTAGAPNFYYNLRGQAYTESKQYDLAIKDFSEAMKLSPKDYEAYKYRSKAYELQKKYDAALTDINKALELATVKGSLLISRARIYRHKQNPDAALADLNEVLKSFPKDTNALSERAALYRQMGKTDLARADEQKIEEIKKQASLNK